MACSESSRIPVLEIESNDVPQDDEELAKVVAKLLVFGFRGTSLNSHAKALIAKGAGGVIFFHRNMKDLHQIAKLCSELKREASFQELLTMVDQEGGLVARFGPPFTRIPAARVIGSTRDTEAAATVASVLGKELRAVGIDMNLAPVLDVDTNPHNPVIGARSFGNSPVVVSEMGYAFIRALQREGVAACAKHFPGHGDTVKDSHVELPCLGHQLPRLVETELPPFAKAVEADVAAVMIGHMHVPAMNAQHPEGESLPASLSRGVVSYLRNQLAFEGLVLTDCLEMGAIARSYPVGQAAVQAIGAGVDMVLVSKRKDLQLSVIDALVKAVRQGKLPYQRILEARGRIARVHKLFAHPTPTAGHMFETKFQERQLRLVGCKEHRDMVANVEYHAAALAN